MGRCEETKENPLLDGSAVLAGAMKLYKTAGKPGPKSNYKNGEAGLGRATSYRSTGPPYLTKTKKP